MDRLEEYAACNNIPIMQKDGILFLTDYIKKNKIRRILEIGSAIGYSAICMAQVDKNIKVVTIERDESRYKVATENIINYNLSDQVEIVFGDALELDINGKFDLIFIDAAKAQYIKFFEKYKNNLTDNGVIISDNLNFHGLTEENVIIKSKNLRGLVRKINEYKEFLRNNKEFHTDFLMIGDGIGVSKKIR